jgi:hypothetical protein
MSAPKEFQGEITATARAAKGRTTARYKRYPRKVESFIVGPAQRRAVGEELRRRPLWAKPKRQDPSPG